jgi:hypothetical protein
MKHLFQAVRRKAKFGQPNSRYCLSFQLLNHAATGDTELNSGVLSVFLCVIVAPSFKSNLRHYQH